MKRRFVIGIVVVVIAFTLFAGFLQMVGELHDEDAAWTQRYRVLDTHGLELYWNSNEAYLFVNENRLGWELTLVELIKSYLRELLGSPTPVDRTRRSLTVVWFTKNTVDTQVFEGMRTHPFIKVVNGHLFLDAKRKWIQARLEQTTPDEQQQFETASRPAGAEYSNVDGWSYRCCMGTPPDFKLSKIPLALDGESVEFVVQNEGGGQKRVLLKRRDDLTPVLTLNDQPRSVTREEYISLMGPEGK